MTNGPISNETLLQQLRWRYATKQFDPDRRIPAEDWQALEEALRLTPSSYGLQPWNFVVVTNPEVRRELLGASWNQTQVAEASHLVVFAIKRDLSLADVDTHVERVAEVRGVAPSLLAGFRSSILKDLIEGPRRPQINVWATCQVYIALGNFMTSAALLGIDTCPLEGIQPEPYDRILGLAAQRLSTVVACAAGYRAERDKYARLPKVRFPRDQVIRHIA